MSGIKIKCPQLTFKVLMMLLPMPATEYDSEVFHPPLIMATYSMIHVTIMVIIEVVSLPKYLYIFLQTQLPHTSFSIWCLIHSKQDSFTFYPSCKFYKAYNICLCLFSFQELIHKEFRW